MTRHCIDAYSKELLRILELPDSPENMQKVSEYILSIVYGQLCSAGNLIFERAGDIYQLREAVKKGS